VAAVYTSPRKADALQDIMTEMPLYEGVKLMEIMEAVYQQGHKDGARDAFDELDAKASEARKAIPHRNPGKPKGSRSR
jgi:hypothetical protein